MPGDLKSRAILAIICAVCFGAGFAASSLSAGGKLEVGKELRDSGAYKFVSPLLACSETEMLLPGEVRAAEEKVRSLIERHKADGSLDDAAVYFRDLTNGPWFGVNQDTRFVPGSLLKVPMMISYLKHLEEYPDAAQEEILYERGASTAKQNIDVAHPLVPGERYSPDQLLERMIIESDNESAYLLYQHIGHGLTSRVYAELGLAAPVAGRDYEIRVRDYATFFRILYNATYLTPESSERALELLSRTDFDRGLAAGVPKDVPVANKFGERNYAGSSVFQLHDCGIVYVPGRPYTLCVMTRGTDLDSLASVIKKISETVYKAVTN